MGNFNNEELKKAKQANSVEELIAIAQESGMELTKEQAQVYFAQLNPQSGELADEELDNVAGGGGGGGCHLSQGLTHCYEGWTCLSCGSHSMYESDYKSGGMLCYSCNRHVSCLSCRNFVAETGKCSYK